MNFTGQYKVTEVRDRERDGKNPRYVVLTPQFYLPGRPAEGGLEILVTDDLLVPEFALNSLHTVTVAPTKPVVRAARPAGLIVPAEDVETDAEAHARIQARLDAEADARRANRG